MPQQFQSAQGTKILRLKQVMERTGLARSTIYDKLDEKSPRHDPTFPQKVELGQSAIGWVESELENWLSSRVQANRPSFEKKDDSEGLKNEPIAPEPRIRSKSLNTEEGWLDAQTITTHKLPESSKAVQRTILQPTSSQEHSTSRSPSRPASRPHNLAEAIVQGGQINDRLLHFLQLKAWTPIMGALLISGIDPPQDCNAVPDQGVGLDGNPLPPGNRRLAAAHRVLREWRDWQEDANDQALELHPVAFLNWCVNDEINTEWLTLFLELAGFVDSQKIDLTSSRFALLTGR